MLVAKRMKVITKFPYWACGRPMKAYRGAYPEGYLGRLEEIIPMKNKQVVHLFAGKSSRVNDSDITIDINQDIEPDLLEDCTGEISIEDNFADVVLVDPPYDTDKMIYGKPLYGTDYVKPYSFCKEAVRITKPGGYICILHQLVYKTLKHTDRYALIPITTGPNMRIRVLNIFRKKNRLTDF